jgi:K+-transporting ATPase KdpF subunit
MRRVVGAAQVNVLYLVSGVIAVVLSLYLLAALLKPEWFE